MTERTVLLAGATQGLGLALAKHYLKKGWRVIATTVRPSPALDALVAEHPDAILVHPLDISAMDSAKALQARLAGERLDVVHIVAGILPPVDKPVWEHDDAEVLRVLQTNAFGGVRLATLLAPQTPPGGVFAFTSSGMGSMGRNLRGEVDLYRVSKAALNMLVRSFAAKHADRAVLLLCPGWAKTEMGGALATVEVDDSVEGMYRLIESPPVGDGGAVFHDYSGAEVPW